MLRGIVSTPFHRHQLTETLTQYSRPLSRLLLMLLRTYKDEDTEADMDINWQPKHAQLTAAIKALRQGLISGQDRENSKLVIPAIHAVVYHLWTYSYTPTSRDPVPDPTERYLMLQSRQADGSFMDPGLITPILAKFKYLIRLVMIYEIVQCQFITAYDDIHKLSDQVRPWVHEKLNNSTFNQLCAYQHRASAIVYETMGVPQLYWPDHNDPTVMNYKGHLVALTDIHALHHDSEAALVKLFEQEVMMGLNLRTERGHIAEDFSNTAVGYSFLSDGRNSFLNHRTTMLQAVLKNPMLQSRFIYFDHQGQMQYKINGLQKWLAGYSELSANLLLRCEMLGGGPGRGTELTAMQYRSTPIRGIRNLIMFGKHVVMLRTYAKTSMLTGRDRLIPHSLDAVTGDILLQDLVFARPFAEWVVSKLYPTKPEIGKLYFNHLFVKEDRLFTTDDLSTLMKRYTNLHLRTELGVNAWRHITIALRRKLCPADVDFMDNGLDDTIGAEQAGHNLDTERRKYGISPDAMAGQAEDVLPLFLNASTGWQKAMNTVPGMYCIQLAALSAILIIVQAAWICPIRMHVIISLPSWCLHDQMESHRKAPRIQSTLKQSRKTLFSR